MLWRIITSLSLAGSIILAMLGLVTLAGGYILMFQHGPSLEAFAVIAAGVGAAIVFSMETARAVEGFKA